MIIFKNLEGGGRRLETCTPSARET